MYVTLLLVVYKLHYRYVLCVSICVRTYVGTRVLYVLDVLHVCKYLCMYECMYVCMYVWLRDIFVFVRRCVHNFFYSVKLITVVGLP